MRRSNSGFTLIEMMIVVAIIGILSTLALDFFGNYTKRSHVAEGLLLSDRARIAVVDYYNSNNNTLPTDNTQAGMDPANELSGNSVTSIAIDNGDIVITFNDKVIDGDNIKYEAIFSDEGVSWDCTGGTLLNVYRPATCR